MGIHSLNKWLESNKQLQQTKSFPPGSRPERPEIVVDGWNLASSIMRSRPKQTLFQDAITIQQQIKQMVTRFQHCGFSLVVFLDGWFNMDKIAEKIIRNRQRISRQCHLSEEMNQFHRLSRDEQRKYSWSKSLIADCLTWKFTYAQAFKKFGCKVYFTKEEADRTIAQYACANADRVIGIFSKDTDFFAFDLPPHTVIIRDTKRTGKASKSNKKTLRMHCFSIRQVWETLGVSTLEERFNLIAWIGCDFVPKRVGASISKKTVAEAISSDKRVSGEKIKIVKEFYTLDDSDAWMDNVTSESDSRSWFNQIRDIGVVSISSRVGAMDMPTAGLLVRELRQHLYAVMGLDAVTEVVMVGDPCVGKITENIGSIMQIDKNFHIGFDAHFQEFVGNEPTLSSIILCSCHIFADVSPFSERETQKIAEIFDKQFQVLGKNVPNRILSCVHGMILGGAPKTRDMTAVNLLLDVVKIVHCLAGEYDVPGIWEWFNIPLFHLGMQQPRKFNEILHSCGLETLSFVRHSRRDKKTTRGRSARNMTRTQRRKN